MSDTTAKTVGGLVEAAEALAAVEDECWSVKCESYPTGGGDADVGWEVVSHHIAKPYDRVEGQGPTPLAAIRNAMRATGKKPTTAVEGTGSSGSAPQSAQRGSPTPSPAPAPAPEGWDEPMTLIERVRCALAMRDADYDATPDLEDVSELLLAYDRLAASPAPAPAPDEWGEGEPKNPAPDALIRWIKENVPRYFNFGGKPVSYRFNPASLAADLLAHAPLAASPTPPQAGWQAIETAPKDGTKIDLLYPYPRGRTIDCYWDDSRQIGGMWVWRTPAWRTESPGGLLPESEWKFHCYPNMKPTHWRPAPPLPPPPQAQQKEGE